MRSLKQKLTIPLFVELVGTNRRFRAFEAEDIDILSELDVVKERNEAASTEHQRSLVEQSEALLKTQRDAAANLQRVSEWRQAKAAHDVRQAERKAAVRKLEQDWAVQSKDIRARIALLNEMAPWTEPPEFEWYCDGLNEEIETNGKDGLARCAALMAEVEADGERLIAMGTSISEESMEIHAAASALIDQGNNAFSTFINTRSACYLREDELWQDLDANFPRLCKAKERLFATIVQLSIFRQEKPY